MCRFVSPMQHALFLFPVIPTLHRTVNQHQYKYYYQRLAEAMEKMGSSTSFREIYVCWIERPRWWVSVRLYCQKKTFRFWQVMLSSKNLVLYAFQCAEFGKYLRYLIRSVCIPLVCIPTSSHILFNLGFWTYWKTLSTCRNTSHLGATLPDHWSFKIFRIFHLFPKIIHFW